MPKDSIMMGKRPYAGKQYSEAAIVTFAECKPQAKTDKQQKLED